MTRLKKLLNSDTPGSHEAHLAVFWGAVVLGVISLVIAAVFSVTSANQSSRAAADANRAARTAANLESSRLKLEAQNEQLLNQLSVQSSQLRVIVDGNATLQRNNHTEVESVAKVVTDIETSLNRLCQIDNCGIPPITSDIATPPSPSSPTTTTTTPPPAPSSTTTTTQAPAHNPPPRRPPPPTTTTTTPSRPCLVTVLNTCLP